MVVTVRVTVIVTVAVSVEPHPAPRAEMTIKARNGSQSLRTAESMLAQAGCAEGPGAERALTGAVLSRSELDG